MDRVAAPVLELGHLLVERSDGDGNVVVVASTEEATLPLEEPHDPIGDAPDGQLPVDRVLVGEDRVRHVGTDDADVGGVLDVDVSQEAAVLDIVDVGGCVVGVGAKKDRVVGLVPARTDLGRTEVPALGRDGPHELRQPLQGLRVLERQVAPVALLLRGVPAPEPRLELLELHEVRAEGREGLRHLVVEAHHEAHHHDDGGDPGHHTEQGERGAELVGPHRVRSEGHVLGPGDLEETHHSVLSASTTGRLEALRAGQ